MKPTLSALPIFGQGTLLLVLSLFFVQLSQAQSLPDEVYLSDDGNMIISGGLDDDGLYDLSVIRQIDLQFDDANYWTLLHSNYDSKTNIIADMTVDGVLYEDVGVRFKGQTSYSMSGDKKSFNISLDHVDSDQRLMGYETLNLGNLWRDESFMREVFYYESIKSHTPAPKVNYVRLSLNGVDWGIYCSTQQLDSDFSNDWFLSNNGSRWRADTEDSGPGGPGGPGGGPMWGDGTAALNDLGPDSSDYQEYYTLKKTEKLNAWEDLINTCDVLENTPLSSLPAFMPDYLDIDRTLWFLASEIAFSDDDSYVYKGKMDYFLYWESETGRMVPLEYDGNSVLGSSNINWSPFYHETDVNYPLLNQLLAVPEYRQRYLAHMRTIMDEYFEASIANTMIDEIAAFIDAEIQTDPQIPFTYSQFLTEVTSLKNLVAQRRNFILSNSEVAQVGPTITGLSYSSPDGLWVAPGAGVAADVTATISSASGIDIVYLYHSTEIVGNFLRSEMYDDGLHNDGAAGDGVYGAAIPGYLAGTPVRFYVEAAADNTAKTVSYAPPGAEHDVYFYQVALIQASNVPVVINELMASNSSAVQDNFGEYDDWIELYNVSSSPVDLSDYILTDNTFNLDKWNIPVGTTIDPGEYLMIWADEDGSQGDNHANFKLSASGESLLLISPSGELHDRVDFEEQTTDQGYARVPNGTGDFIIQAPTWGFNNDDATAIEEIAATANSLQLYPVPATDQLVVQTDLPEMIVLEVYDTFGRLLLSQECLQQTTIVVSELPGGTYYIQASDGSRRPFVVLH